MPRVARFRDRMSAFWRSKVRVFRDSGDFRAIRPCHPMGVPHFEHTQASFPTLMLSLCLHGFFFVLVMSFFSQKGTLIA